jgi:transmembrane sensor
VTSTTTQEQQGQSQLDDDLPGGRSLIEREAYAWMMRFASGEANPADLAALKQWSQRDPSHAEAFRRVSRTWKALGPLGQELAAERDLSTQSTHQSAAMISARPRMGRRAFLGGALAASVVGGAVVVARAPFGLWPSWSELAADYRTQTGEQRRITLSDNTAIEMNTQTSIAVRSTGGKADRIELISGEAMISASPASSEPFTVLAADGRVVATNARFNVRYQGQIVCVSCLAGDVRVERQASVLPVPVGRQVFYSDQGIGAVAPVDPTVVTAWQDGIVIFQSTPVSEVVAEVNRYRSGKIILTNKELGRRVFNARLRIANIDRVIGQLEQAFGARATTLPGRVVLLG